MVSTIIGPATILMLIAGAFVTVFDVSIVDGYIASVIPGVLFFVICLVCSTKVQLVVAQILSGFYVIIMMVVMVGLLITALTQSPYHPSVIFLLGLVIIFVVAAVLHPREWVNILYGFLYFVSIPSGFLVQVIYSLCNLNDVSWGTRESSTPKSEEKKKSDTLSKIVSPFSKLINTSPTKDDSEKEKLYKLLEKTVDMLCAKSQIGNGSIKQNLVSDDKANQPCVDENKTPKNDNSKRKVCNFNFTRECKGSLSTINDFIPPVICNLLYLFTYRTEEAWPLNLKTCVTYLRHLRFCFYKAIFSRFCCEMLCIYSFSILFVIVLKIV